MRLILRSALAVYLLLLLFILSIFALCVIVYFLFATDFVANAFWAVCGTWELIALASSLLEGFVKNKDIDTTYTLMAYLQLIFSGALDAIYLGTCIFAFKSLFFRLEKKSYDGQKYYVYGYAHHKLLLTVIAVCIGIAVKPLLSFDSRHLSVVLQGFVSILLLIFGLTRFF